MMSENLMDDRLSALLAEFGKSGVQHLHLRHGDLEIHLSNSSKAPSLATSHDRPAPEVQAAPAALGIKAPASPTKGASEVTPVASLPDNVVIVAAPNLGTFYRSPKPGAAPYVELGAKFKAGDEMCLIEVMKLFTAVRAEFSGTLHSILAEDGAMVEAGQPLFALVAD